MDYKKIIANMTLEEKALQLSQVAAADIIQDVDAVVQVFRIAACRKSTSGNWAVRSISAV